MTTKSYNCSQCRFYDEIIEGSGRCRRWAPDNLDLYGFEAKGNNLDHECGLIDANVTTGGTIDLYRSGQATIGLPTGLSAGGSFNDYTTFPFVNPGGFFLKRIAISASLLNVGTDTVGDDVRLKIRFVSLNPDQSLVQEIDMPMPEANIGVLGNTTDEFVYATHELDDLASLPPGNIGVQLDLTGDDDNLIKEIRNFNLSFQTEQYDEDSTVNKYCTVDAEQWCGEFRKALAE